MEGATGEIQGGWKERWGKQTQEGSQRTERLADWGLPDTLSTDRALAKHQELTKVQSTVRAHWPPKLSLRPGG